MVKGTMTKTQNKKKIVKSMENLGINYIMIKIVVIIIIKIN